MNKSGDMHDTAHDWARAHSAMLARKPHGVHDTITDVDSAQNMVFPEISPFRQRAHQDAGMVQVRLRALQKAVRGTAVLGVDLKVWMWLGAHSLVPFALYMTQTSLTVYISAALDSRYLWNADGLKGIAGIVLLAALGIMYRSLYCSDGGWLTASGKVPRLSQLCIHCLQQPTLRSKHSKATGHCVHKFDHHCWLLSTDIGDGNHRRFWCFLALSTVAIMWAMNMVLSEFSKCFDASSDVACYAGRGGHLAVHVVVLLFLLAGLGFIGFLLVLHTYLAATNQTTYEVLKGPHIAYMQPFFKDECKHKKLEFPSALIHLFLAELRRNPPPRPFSQGIAKNLWVFFMTPPLRDYAPQLLPQSLLPDDCVHDIEGDNNV